MMKRILIRTNLLGNNSWQLCTLPLVFCYKTEIFFLNNTKYLDPSYKTGLELWDNFRRKKYLTAEFSETTGSKKRGPFLKML